MAAKNSEFTSNQAKIFLSQVGYEIKLEKATIDTNGKE
jgi:hypothetical protein